MFVNLFINKTCMYKTLYPLDFSSTCRFPIVNDSGGSLDAYCIHLSLQGQGRIFLQYNVTLFLLYIFLKSIILF